MNRGRLLIILALLLMLTACQSMGDKDTIARLRHQKIEIKEEKIEGGLEKAMQSYQRFLQETPDSALAPEAIRRLADLKIEKEYGTITEGEQPAERATAGKSASRMTAPAKAAPVSAADHAPARPETQAARKREADTAFEKRATQSQPIPAQPPREGEAPEPKDDLERAGPLEAVELYKKLLAKYPLYDRNDQVLYQMSRAYEELGRIDEAMAVMERLVREYPQSRYIDEVQFRRAEFFFAHRKYLDAEDAYKSIVDLGKGSYYYELALYKLGWTFYKQELYDEAQHRFIALLDHKVSVGYDFDQTEDETERKRMDDTFRVISLGFSNLGGADSVVKYFSQHGKRSYEDNVYSNLGEFYFDKRRYADASAAYNAFVSRNPFHKKAPNFHMRVIEIHTAGGFPTLVLDAKKAFASTYGLKAEYWKYFDPKDRQDVLDILKTNLTDLAHHYHAAYQKPRKKEDKPAHYKEALHWYREFLASFPAESESPDINYQLADLLLENKAFGQAAAEYEKTAYDYPSHEKSSEAGYAAVYALRKQLEAVAPDNKDVVKRDIVRSSMKFVDTFPQHEKAALVLGAAAEDLYAMKAYERALAAGTRVIKDYPSADVEIVRTAWLVSAHSSFELQQYKEAEAAYTQVLASLPPGDKTRAGLVDNLAASVYKQGEQARAAQDYRTAADHFLRVALVAPTATMTIRASAEYDGAAALIELEEWNQAASVLKGFRNSFPDHELQPDVTKKIAYVYKESGQLSLAAQEYERIETETKDDAIRRDALQVAADLYVQDGNTASALAVYRRYVGYFPQPVELNLETRNKIAEILKERNDRPAYLAELEQIVAIDAAAGGARTPRTRYLAGKAALVLAQKTYESFAVVKLVKPLKVNLAKKKDLMKKAIKEFNHLIDYEMGEVTAAATFYLAEIYANFSKSMMASERPVLTFDYHTVKSGETLSGIAKQYETDVGRIASENNLNKSKTIVAGKKLKIPRGLNPLELEQYELALEEQAYPFEEKAIKVHESNLALISKGVYNEWTEKSLQKLAKFVPARYDKPEEPSEVVASLETYVFALARPATPAPLDGQPGAVANAQPNQPGTAGAEAGTQPVTLVPVEASEPGTAPQAAAPGEPDASGSVTDAQSGQPAPADESEPGTAAQAPTAGASDDPGSPADTQNSQPAPSDASEPDKAAQTPAPGESEGSGSVAEIQSEQPAPSDASEPDAAAQAAAAGASDASETIADTQSGRPAPADESEPDQAAQAPAAGASDASETVAGTQSGQPAPAAESEPDTAAQTPTPGESEGSGSVAETQSERPAPSDAPEPGKAAQAAAAGASDASETIADTQSGQPAPAAESEPDTAAQTPVAGEFDDPGTVTETQSGQPAPAAESEPDTAAQTPAPGVSEGSGSVAETQSGQPVPADESEPDKAAQAPTPGVSDATGSEAETQSGQPVPADEPKSASKVQAAAPGSVDGPGSAWDQNAAQDGDDPGGLEHATVE